MDFHLFLKIFQYILSKLAKVRYSPSKSLKIFRKIIFSYFFIVQKGITIIGGLFWILKGDTLFP